MILEIFEMRRPLLNILAAIGVAIALSGCIIVPAHRGAYGYAGAPPPPPRPVYHNGY
jgi:hypothetical protein